MNKNKNSINSKLSTDEVLVVDVRVQSVAFPLLRPGITDNFHFLSLFE